MIALAMTHTDSVDQQTSPQGTLMQGKRGLIFGVANGHSMAWGIAKHIHSQGGQVCLTYQGETLKKRVDPLAAGLNGPDPLPCDVGNPGDVERVFDEVAKIWPTIDFVVHAVAFSDKNELRGSFLDTSRDNFSQTLLISCYSFIEIARHASKLMSNGGSLLTLSYYGAEKVVPHYNVMAVAKAALETSVRYAAEDLGKRGIRVNTLSCGPMKTLASSGIGDFSYILQWNQNNAPLRRSITLDDVGRAALFALSDLGSGMTGETVHIDAGYHVVGMKAKDAPDIVLKRDQGADQ
jgi:enoyl-[acyl-carrier protein] reductase I